MDAEHLYSYLSSLMRAYTTANLVGVAPDEFESRLRSMAEEGGFEWGHDHDFGAFRLEGVLGDRHIRLLCNYLVHFGLGLDALRGRDVLDVGCWTGGTSLLLAALGNRVLAVEEAEGPARAAQYLADAFGLADRLVVEAKSLFDCAGEKYWDRFDVAHFSGVVYHLSDPVVGLRIVFNALRPGELVFVESADFRSAEPVCGCTGHSFCPSGAALRLMMETVGFGGVEVKPVGPRQYAVGTKGQQVDLPRAGLSVPRIR